ncbi:MAG: ribonuclease H-like domain-containing protein [Magnetospirillum sp. WYHS-4]
MTDRKPVIELHEGDLPAGISFGNSVAVDTETTGLHPHRDRLCLVQLSAGDGVCHLVRIHRDRDAANLKALFADPAVVKIFHFARFDVTMIRRHLGVDCRPVYCTRIASRLARTYTQSHGLKDCCKELLGIEISKEQQSSDWAAAELSPAQRVYAATDVLHLHALRDRLDAMLAREGRRDLARACFDFLGTRAELDLGGWADEDIFSHS